MEAEDPTTEMEALGVSEEGPPDPFERTMPAPERPATLLDEVVARRDQIARRRHELVLDIPGYNLRGVNRLAVRYRYPEIGAKGIAAMEARAVRSGLDDAILPMQIDILVQCCDEVLTRDDAGALQRLDPDEDGPPLKFGPRLADLFRIEIPDGEKAKARFVCRSLFSPQFPETGVWEGDFVMTDHSQAVQGWLQRIGAEVDEEFSGE